MTVPPEFGTTVDLEIGVAAAEMPEIEAAPPPEIRAPALHPTTFLERSRLPDPRRRELWARISKVSFVTAMALFLVFEKPKEKFFTVLIWVLAFVYFIVLTYVSLGRVPVPYTLRRSEKRIFESAFVVACSCGTYYARDFDVRAIILGLDLMFNLIPLLNFWWCFANIGLGDCCLIIAIDAALVCFRNRGVVVFALVAGIGVALQLIKYPFRQFCSVMFKCRRGNL